MQDATVTLGGEQWQIKFVSRRRLPKAWGLCVWSERTIYVRRDLSYRNRLDTLLHEMRHAQHPVLFEAGEFIDWSSTELADGLLKTQAVRE